jgi:hypothetical protein
MAIRRSIDFELSEDITYSKDGADLSSNKLLLKSPTAKNRKECLYLKQSFLRALPKGNAETVDGPDNAAEPEADDIINLLGSSQDVDLSEVFEVARNLFTRNTVFVDGVEPLTTNLFDRIDLDDAQRMFGEYIINFIIQSALKKQKKS